MAKGQMRSNKEAKKPKQDKSKKPAATKSDTASVFERADAKKGKK